MRGAGLAAADGTYVKLSRTSMRTTISTIAGPGVFYSRGTGIGDGHSWHAYQYRWLDPLGAAVFMEVEQVAATTDLRVIARNLPGVMFRSSGAAADTGVRQYTAVLTKEQWLSTVPPAIREGAAQWAEDENVTAETISVFLDRKGRPVQEIFFILPNSALVTVQIDFSHWGEPVTIEPPPQRKSDRPDQSSV